jgi:hypothetical protein
LRSSGKAAGIFMDFALCHDKHVRVIAQDFTPALILDL